MTNVGVQPPPGMEEGVRAGIERAQQRFGLAPRPQGDLLQIMSEEVQETKMGPAAAEQFAELVTTANIGRQQFGEPPVDRTLVRDALEFFKKLFDGLLER